MLIQYHKSGLVLPNTYLNSHNKYSRNKVFVQIQKVENTVTCMQDPEKAWQIEIEKGPTSYFPRIFRLNKAQLGNNKFTMQLEQCHKFTPISYHQKIKYLAHFFLTPYPTAWQMFICDPTQQSQIFLKMQFLNSWKLS